MKSSGQLSAPPVKASPAKKGSVAKAPSPAVGVDTEDASVDKELKKTQPPKKDVPGNGKPTKDLQLTAKKGSAPTATVAKE